MQYRAGVILKSFFESLDSSPWLPTAAGPLRLLSKDELRAVSQSIKAVIQRAVEKAAIRASQLREVLKEANSGGPVVLLRVLKLHWNGIYDMVVGSSTLTRELYEEVIRSIKYSIDDEESFRLAIDASQVLNIRIIEAAPGLRPQEVLASSFDHVREVMSSARRCIDRLLPHANDTASLDHGAALTAIALAMASSRPIASRPSEEGESSRKTTNAKVCRSLLLY